MWDDIPLFSGTGQPHFVGSGTDWLRVVTLSLRYARLPDNITKDRAFLDVFTLRLVGPAQEWLNGRKDLLEFIHDESSPEQDKARGEILANAFQLRFPVVRKVPVDRLAEVDRLQQGESESLEDYYARAAELMAALGITSSDTSTPVRTLSQKVIECWAGGLKSPEWGYAVAHHMPKSLEEALEAAIRERNFKHAWGLQVARKTVLSNGHSTNIRASVPQFQMTKSSDARANENTRPVVQNVIPVSSNTAPAPPIAAYPEIVYGDRLERRGLPPAESQEAFDLCPTRVQELIRQNGNQRACLRCGDTGHLAEQCANPRFTREEQTAYRMFIGLRFRPDWLPNKAKSNLHVTAENTQYSWLKTPTLVESRHTAALNVRANGQENAEAPPPPVFQFGASSNTKPTPGVVPGAAPNNAPKRTRLNVDDLMNEEPTSGKENRPKAKASGKGTGIKKTLAPI